MTAADVRAAVGGAWQERDGQWRVEVAMSAVRAAAAAMLAAHGRFAALVGVPREGGLELTWHWDLDGRLLSVVARLGPGDAVPSIVDIYPGADWAERETREYFAVTFDGRASTPPLMLREGDQPGILARPEGRRP
jgi:Ni,Fe-hydrogenase III component G